MLESVSCEAIAPHYLVLFVDLESVFRLSNRVEARLHLSQTLHLAWNEFIYKLIEFEE